MVLEATVLESAARKRMNQSIYLSIYHMAETQYNQDNFLGVKPASSWGRKVLYVTLNMAWLLVSDGQA